MLLNILLLIWIHFIADFILQTDEIAKYKSQSIKILAYHCMLYTLPFLIMGFNFAILNGILHFIVDYCSSRVTKYYWNNGNRRNFFITIGFDQAIHMTCLITTFILL